MFDQKGYRPTPKRTVVEDTAYRCDTMSADKEAGLLAKFPQLAVLRYNGVRPARRPVFRNVDRWEINQPEPAQDGFQGLTANHDDPADQISLFLVMPDLSVAEVAHGSSVARAIIAQPDLIKARWLIKAVRRGSAYVYVKLFQYELPE